MNVLHLGSDRNAVKTRQLLTQQTAFQTCMDGHDFRLLAEHLLIGLDHDAAQFGISLVLPCGIFAHLGIRGIVELGQFPQLVQQLLLLAVDTAANRESHLHLVAQLRNAQVQAGLNQAGHFLAHSLHTIGCTAEQTDNLCGNLSGQCIAAQRIQIEGLNGCLRLVILFPNLSLQRFGNAVDALQIDTHSNHTDLTGTGNCIVLGAAHKGRQAQGHQSLNTAHEFAHNLVGIGAVLVDLRTGVTALQAIHTQTDARTVDRTASGIHRDRSSGTTGAGNRENTLVLGVQVQQESTLQLRQINGSSADSVGMSDTVQKTIRQITRDMSLNFVRGTGMWFYDMNGGWFEDDSIEARIKTIKEEYDRQYDLSSNNEVAVFVAEDNYNYLTADIVGNDTERTTYLLSALYEEQRRELSAMGASYDIFSIDDVTEGRVTRDYKLNIVLSPFELTDEECTLLKAKFAKNHQVVLWIYLPGISDGTGNAAEHLKRLVDMDVTYFEEAHALQAEVTGTIDGTSSDVVGTKYGNFNANNS